MLTIILYPMRADPKRYKSKTILSNEPCGADLEHICAVLNAQRELGIQLELESIIQKWSSCKTSQEMFTRYPKLVHELRKIFAWYMQMMPSPVMRRFDLQFPKIITWDGKLIMQGIHKEPYWRARELLTVLVNHPQQDKLAGPCPRCGRYFVKKTAKQKVYCSRNCGTGASAAISTRKRRQQERAEKLFRAVQSNAQWSTSRSPKSWKDFVAAQHPDITPKWLTRAVRRGELKEPNASPTGAPVHKRRKR